MSLFYILTGPTLSLLVTLTDSFLQTLNPHSTFLAWLGPIFCQSLSYSVLPSRCSRWVISIKHHAGRTLDISALAFCQDLVTTSALHHFLTMLTVKNWLVLACCALCSVTQNQADSNALAQVSNTCTHYKLVQMSLHTSQHFCEVFHAFIVGRIYIVGTHCTKCTWWPP